MPFFAVSVGAACSQVPVQTNLTLTRAYHSVTASGVAAYVKGVCPNVRVIGVEAQGSDAMTLSLEQGKPRSNSTS